MSIQDSVNSMINQAATIATIGKVAKEGKDFREELKQSSKDIKGSIESLKEDHSNIPGSIPLKISKADREGYEGYIKAMTNPNIRKFIDTQRDRAVNNALMKERNTKFKQSMMERSQTLVKQKQDVPKIKEELRIGKQKIDPDSPLYLKIMSQMEERDGK